MTNQETAAQLAALQEALNEDESAPVAADEAYPMEVQQIAQECAPRAVVIREFQHHVDSLFTRLTVAMPHNTVVADALAQIDSATASLLAEVSQSGMQARAQAMRATAGWLERKAALIEGDPDAFLRLLESDGVLSSRRHG